MITPKTIILPIDFSAPASRTAAHASILARQYGATVVLLHVLPPMLPPSLEMGGSMEMMVEWYREQKPAMEARLQEFAKKHLAGCQTKTVCREGDAADEILSVARGEKADLIMLATHGYGAFRRLLLGSVAAKVLHDAHIPVLTSAHVESPSGDVEKVKSIVVAVEADARAAKLIAAGAGMAKEFGAALHVVHATPEDGSGAVTYQDPAWRLEVAAKLEELVQEAGAQATVHVVPGEAAAAVRQVATDVMADLVILGRHVDHGVLGRLWAHSYAIVREAPCAVLSI